MRVSGSSHCSVTLSAAWLAPMRSSAEGLSWGSAQGAVSERGGFSHLF